MRSTRCTGALVGVGILAAIGASGDASAGSSRKTLSWQVQDQKDVLTDRVTRTIASEVTFLDGISVQASAKCGRFGVEIVFAAFKSDGGPNSFAWQHGEIELPVLVDDRLRKVHAHTEISGANAIPVLFYDETTMRKIFDSEVKEAAAPIFQMNTSGLSRMMNNINATRNEELWKSFTSGAAGTLADLDKATSVRIQLPLADGSANVADINPQDALLKDFARQCLSKLAPVGSQAGFTHRNLACQAIVVRQKGGASQDSRDDFTQVSLAAGTSVEIIGGEERGSLPIRMANGAAGWVNAKAFDPAACRPVSDRK